ncbi:MAG: alpha/beta fold hydrolase [Paracoccaceae bacterium]
MLTPIKIDSAGGEYMESVLILNWHAAPGDAVKAGQVIVTVETAKAATDVEAETDGFLAEVRFASGQEAPVGVVLGTISDVPFPVTEQPAPVAQADAPVPVVAPLAARARVVASPLARRVAAAAGLDLSALKGSGPNGRIKRRDVDAALAAKPATPAPARPFAAPAVLAASPPVVLLHGFGADRSAWRQVLPLLPAGLTTITPDLPGHGAHAAEPAISVQDLALTIGDELETAGIADCHLVGHSLGGATALALTALGRIAVRSLTLLAPGGLGPEVNGGFIAGLAQATTAEALTPWLNVMVGDPAVLPQGYAQAVLRQMDRIGNRPALQSMAAALFPNGTQAFDLTRALSGVEVPCRIIWGKADAVIPPAHAIRAPAQAAVHMLPGIGHVPQIEAPALTARLIAQTIRSAG